MTKFCCKRKSESVVINRIGTTSDTLSSRGGLSLFVRYLRNVGVMRRLERLFGGLRKSRKGQAVTEIFKQFFCFFLDGTSSHLVHFDLLKRDAGYAATIESSGEQMQSSHAMKRFCQLFSGWHAFLFRPVLRELFLWRLKVERPAVVVLGLDTMVMDNDEAEKREGVEPTYKKVKGFQPLQMTWGRYLVDAVFRGGSKHSNHGESAANMVLRVVKLIRRHYTKDVPIIVRIDSGFFDQDLFEKFEEAGIGYTCGGKIYDDIKQTVAGLDAWLWRRYGSGAHLWNYVEFGDRRGTWSKFRRAFYLSPLNEGEQLLLEFSRPETIIYTNLGQGFAVDDQLRRVGVAKWLEAEAIIELSHDRGRDELVHRAVKEFGSETLPFERFSANAVFYYMRLVHHDI